MGFVFIYITNPNKKEAERISSHLVNERLIACANIFPISSIYWWKGKIEKAKEYVLVAKTREENFEKVKKEVERLHPYKIPCITKIAVEANEKFEQWIKEEVK
jgi:periplasmic divalent cation tolerance protein